MSAPLCVPKLLTPAAASARAWSFQEMPKAQVSPGYDAEFLLYDVIGVDRSEGPFARGITAEGVYYMLRSAPKGRTLMRINSVGGSVTEGMAIFDLLNESTSEITTRVEGICGSIASIIMLAGQHREIAPNGFVMIHNPYGKVEGGEEEIRAVADFLGKEREKMYGIYSARTGLPRDEVVAMCGRTTYFSAEEAVNKGFCTRVAGSKAQVFASIKPEELVDAPEKLLRAVQAAAQTTPKVTAMADQDEKDTKAEGDKDEDFKEKFAKAQEEVKSLKAALEDAKASDIERMKEDLKSAKAELEEMRAKAETDEDEPKAKAKTKSEDADDEEIKAANRVVTLAMQLTGCKDKRVLEGQLMAYIDRAGTQTNTHEARVKALIAEGKLAPARKEWALKASAANLDAYIAAIGNQAILPVNQEHKPNDEAGKTKARVTEAESVQLTAEELLVCKQFNNDPVKMLALKRATLTGQA